MKGFPRSMSRANPQKQQIRKVTIPVKALALSVVGAAGVGFGSSVIGGLPQGNLLYLGAVSYLKFTKSAADANAIATFAGNFAIGTAPNANAQLSDASDADLIPSTAIAAAVAGVTTLIRSASTDALGGGVIDNTDGSLELNLNMLVDDASISGTAAFTVDGVVTIAFIVLGDD